MSTTFTVPNLPPIRSGLTALEGDKLQPTMTRDWYRFFDQMQTLIGNVSQATSGLAGDATSVSHDAVPVPGASQSTPDFKGDHLSVSMFGVAGDGVTDDTAALQAAVTAAAGRTLLIPPASNYYLVSGTINIPSNCTIWSEKATLIVQTAVKTPLFRINGQADVIIHGCSLQGPGASDWDPAHNTSAHLIEVVNSSSVRLEQLYLSQYGHAAISFSQTKKLWIHECVIVGLPGSVINSGDNYNFGIVALGSGIGYGPVTITDCDISQGVTGINSQDDINDWLISGCAIHDTCGQHAIYLNPGKHGPVIVGNRFYNLMLDGVKLTKTQGNVENCETATIAGNQFTNVANACVNLGLASADIPAVYLQNILVEANTMEHANYGISITGVADSAGTQIIQQKFLVSGNNLSGISNYGIRVQNMTGKIQGNYVHDVGGTGINVYPTDGQTVYLNDNVVTGAGNGLMYTPGSLVATQMGLYLGPGNHILHNNSVTVDAAASYSAIYFQANLTFAGSNFIDPSKPISYSSATVLSAMIQTNDGRFLMGDPTAGGPQATAALEIRSTTRGFLPPNMSTTQRDAISSPVAGLMIFNGSVGRHQYYFGGWKTFAVSPATPDYAPYTAGDTTPSIAGFGPLVTMQIANSAATTITNFTGASGNGQVLILSFADANTTVQRGGSITLDGAVNFVSALFRTLQLVYIGGIWRQVGKVSANG